MEGVKQWAFSVCAAMVACGIAQMVLPRSGMEKIFRITVSVFFLCCLLSPVVLYNPQLQLEWEECAQEDIQRRAQSLANVVDEQTDSVIQGELVKIIEEKLDEMGIKYHAVTINMNRNGQSDTPVEFVAIELDAVYEPKHQSIHDTLETALGLPVRLGYAVVKEG